MELGSVGRGRKLRILAMAAETGRTFTRPLVETAFAVVVSGPVIGLITSVVGSKTMPARAGTLAPSVVVTNFGLVQPVEEVVPSLQMKSPKKPVRSPDLSAAVGTVTLTDAALRRRVA